MIEVRWYYRPNEIPDGVYSLLMQDRFYENSKFILKQSVHNDGVVTEWQKYGGMVTKNANLFSP
jgi:hypothetical protein